MSKARIGVGLVVSCVLLGSSAAARAQQEAIDRILLYQPKQKGVAISTPTADEAKGCKLTTFRGSQPGSSGFLLADGNGKPLRRLLDSNGDRQIDVWSYYKDGIEVYREIDSRFYNQPDKKLDAASQKPRPDEYRWLHTGGTRWGVDFDGDGTIDAWKLISAEEVAQEVFQAVVTNDLARLKALFPNAAELRALGLPTAEAQRVEANLKQAAEKFQDTVAKMPAGAQLVQVEAAVPQCVPADVAGTERDLVKYPSRGIIYVAGDKKNDWMQTGEMIQVGLTWRLLEAPYLGDVPTAGGTTSTPTTNPEMQKLLETLSELDKNPPATPPTPRADAAVVRYNLKRADLLEQVAAKAKTEERETWVKQIADSLSAAHLHAAPGDTTALKRLWQLKDQAAAGTNLAGYLTYRALWSEYSPQLGGGDKAAKAQKEWMEKLTAFVQSYPKAEDTPDALFHLGMGSEFAGKEDEAKRWYKQLATGFPEHPMCRKAQGAVRRLELAGKDMELAGSTAGGASFDITSLKGKVVAVYYWASYGDSLDGDVAKLKQAYSKLGSKGFEVVTVNLDEQSADAQRAIQRLSMPGTHLLQTGAEGGGLNGPLATQYGIMGVPSLFLVGKDGKVIRRTLNVAGLEEAAQKALQP